MIRQLSNSHSITSGLNFDGQPVIFMDEPENEFDKLESLVLVLEDIQAARRVHAAAAEAVAHFEGASRG